MVRCNVIKCFKLNMNCAMQCNYALLRKQQVCVIICLVSNPEKGKGWKYWWAKIDKRSQITSHPAWQKSKLNCLQKYLAFRERSMQHISTLFGRLDSYVQLIIKSKCSRRKRANQKFTIYLQNSLSSPH